MPRKSLAEHALTGTKPEYVTPDTVAVAPGRPRYPKGISAAARKEFKRLCNLLEQRRSLTPGDEELLRLFAVVFDRHQRALEKIAEEGEIKIYYRLDNQGKQVPSERPNLWLKVAQESERFMVSVLDRLGLTPMNRGKVKPCDVPKEAKPEEHDPRLTREPAPDTTPKDPLDEFEGIDVEAIQ
jgi:P27 family predicted phage terminase small subunit